MKKTEKFPLQNIRKVGVFQINKVRAGSPGSDPTSSVVATSTHFGY